VSRIIAVANQKGGVGKTTTAVNLAASLAHLGQETLVIDMDPQANLTSGLGIARDALEKHISHVLLEGAELEEVLRESGVEWLDVAPSHMDLYGAEVELVNADNRERRLADALNKFHRAYAHVIIDCPPALNLLTLNALAAADAVLIPMPCEYYALEGLSMLVRTIEKIQGGLNPRLEMDGVLITMFDGRANLSQQVLGEIRKFFGNKVYQTVIPRNVRLAEAPSHGQPAIVYDRQSSGASAYVSFAREFLARQGVPVPAMVAAGEPVSAG